MPYFGDIIIKLKDYIEAQNEIKREAIREELSDCFGIKKDGALSKTLSLKLIPKLR